MGDFQIETKTLDYDCCANLKATDANGGASNFAAVALDDVDNLPPEAEPTCASILARGLGSSENRDMQLLTRTGDNWKALAGQATPDSSSRRRHSADFGTAMCDDGNIADRMHKTIASAQCVGSAGRALYISGSRAHGARDKACTGTKSSLQECSAAVGPRAVSFLRLNGFLLRTHMTSLIAALAEGGWLEVWEKERLCHYARDDAQAWALTFLRIYSRFMQTADVQVFVADLRAQLA